MGGERFFIAIKYSSLITTQSMASRGVCLGGCATQTHTNYPPRLNGYLRFHIQKAATLVSGGLSLDHLLDFKGQGLI